MKGFPDLPPIWWAGSIALIYLGKWMLPSVHLDNAILSLASRVLLFTAVAIIGGSAIWFWRKRTPIEPHHVPKSLIVEGPYRLSRNPIYLSLVMLTLASALGHGSVIGLLTALGLWLVLDRRFAATEEALLLREFGDAATAYFAATRRWL